MNELQIARLVDAFYAKVRRDQMLGPIFDSAIGDQWDAHLATMRTFWSTIMLGSATYKGNPLAAHVRLPEINSAHFDRWLDLWRETAAEVCGANGVLFIQRAEAIAGRLLATVSYARAHVQIGRAT